MTIDPEIVIRFSFERKICLLVSNWHFLITLVKAVLTLNRDCYILSLSIFSRNFLALHLMIAASVAVIGAAYFLYSHVYNGFIYWDCWSAFSYAVNLFNYILLCCRVSSTSFNWLPYFFKVCVWGLKKCKFLHPLFFLFEVQPVILPLETAFRLSHRMSCVISTIFCLKEILYFLFHIFKKLISWNWVSKLPCNIWPSGYLEGWRQGVKEICLRLYILMLGACHGFYNQSKVCPWKPSQAIGEQVTYNPCRHTRTVLFQFWNLTLEGGTGRIPSHNILPAAFPSLRFLFWQSPVKECGYSDSWCTYTQCSQNGSFPPPYLLGLPPDFSVFMLQKTLSKQPLPSTTYSCKVGVLCGSVDLGKQ